MFKETLEVPVGMETVAEDAGEAGTAEEALPKKEISETKLAAEPVSVSVRVGEASAVDDERTMEDVMVPDEANGDETMSTDVEPMWMLISRWTSGVEGSTSMVDGNPKPSGSFWPGDELGGPASTAVSGHTWSVSRSSAPCCRGKEEY